MEKKLHTYKAVVAANAKANKSIKSLIQLLSKTTISEIVKAKSRLIRG